MLPQFIPTGDSWNVYITQPGAQESYTFMVIGWLFDGELLQPILATSKGFEPLEKVKARYEGHTVGMERL